MASRSSLVRVTIPGTHWYVPETTRLILSRVISNLLYIELADEQEGPYCRCAVSRYFCWFRRRTLWAAGSWTTVNTLRRHDDSGCISGKNLVAGGQLPLANNALTDFACKRWYAPGRLHLLPVIL